MMRRLMILGRSFRVDVLDMFSCCCVEFFDSNRLFLVFVFLCARESCISIVSYIHEVILTPSYANRHQHKPDSLPVPRKMKEEN